MKIWVLGKEIKTFNLHPKISKPSLSHHSYFSNKCIPKSRHLKYESDPKVTNSNAQKLKIQKTPLHLSQYCQ